MVDFWPYLKIRRLRINIFYMELTPAGDFAHTRIWRT